MSHVRFDPLADYAIGVDIGGTKLNAGLIRADGEVSFVSSRSTLGGSGGVMEQAAAAIETVLAEVRHRQPGIRLRGIGVGTAGQVDARDGSIRFASELIPGYTGTPVRDLLEERFGLPVAVDNDVNVLVWTEKMLGAGKGAKQLLCLTLGTGVGGALMADGRLLRGAWGGAGELGHVTVDFNGPRCICGSRGCLEMYASGTSIARRMKELLQREAGDAACNDVDAKQVFARWQAGDRFAGRIMQETIAALGSALGSMLHLFNPEVIIIGGGVAEAGDVLLRSLREEVAARTMPSFLEGVRIEKAYQGNWSGMIGAGLQWWHR